MSLLNMICMRLRSEADTTSAQAQDIIPLQHCLPASCISWVNSRLLRFLCPSSINTNLFWLHSQVTAWSTARHETIIVAQIRFKFLVFYGVIMFITVFTKACNGPRPELEELSPHHRTRLFKIHFNIVLPSMSRIFRVTTNHICEDYSLLGCFCV
jgi:hypothetical protein